MAMRPESEEIPQGDTLMAIRPEREEIMRNVTVGAVQMSCSWDVQENIEKRTRWCGRLPGRARR